MSTAVLEAKTADYDVEEIEYLRHGDKPLLARIYKPRGAGPWARGGPSSSAGSLGHYFSPNRKLTITAASSGVIVF